MVAGYAVDIMERQLCGKDVVGRHGWANSVDMGKGENIMAVTELTCEGVTVVLEELPHWDEYNELVDELESMNVLCRAFAFEKRRRRRETLPVLYDELYEAIYGEVPA